MVLPIVDPLGMVLTNLILHYIGHFHVNFIFPDPVVLEKIFKWPHPIFTFLRLSPLWKGPGPLYVNIPRMICTKFEWNSTSSSRKDFQNLSLYFYIFTIISPWKLSITIIWSVWIPFNQGCFLPCLVEIGMVVLEKKLKMWKVYRQTNDGWSEKLELSAPVS
jgi:hypothetical protein